MTVYRRTLFATTALVGALSAALPLSAAHAAPAPTRAATPAPSAAPALRAAPVRAVAPGGTGLHWLMRSGQHTLVVDVVDRTGWDWPVRAASRDWTTAHVRYRYVRSCGAGVPCVVVREGSYGPTDWSGSTDAFGGQMQTFAGTVQIRLNDTYRMSATEHRAVACHELGHALGLDHEGRASSCLESVPQAVHSDGVDRTRLEALYGHGG